MRVMVLGLVVLLASTSLAQAETVRLMGAYGQADMARACQSGGGTPTGGGLSPTYGCKKENCDGQGGTCSVECTDPLNCLATTPNQTAAPTTLNGLMLKWRRGAKVR